MALIEQQGRVQARFNTTGCQIKRAPLWYWVRFLRCVLPEVGRKSHKSIVSKLSWQPTWRPARGPVTPQLCQKRNDFALQLQLIDVQVKASVAVDFARLVSRKAADLAAAALNGDQRSIHRLLRAMQPWVPQQGYRLCDDEGTPAQTYTEERQHIRSHFEEKTCSSTCTMESLIDHERSMASNLALQPKGRNPAATDLSSIRMRHQTSACGIDLPERCG